MCTIILYTRAFSETPLLVAANRDERSSRPALPPSIVTEAGLRILRPIDLEAGGTWLGLNERGLFVGITNRFGKQRDPLRRSRGMIVIDALHHENADEAAAAIFARDPLQENGFHLVIADRTAAHLVWNDGSTMRHETLAPGLHVVTERSFDAAPTQREDLIRAKLSAVTGPPSDEALKQLLSSHVEDGFEGVCVHVPILDYGTRSSTIVRLGLDPQEMRVLHADGRPCTTPYLLQPVPA